MKRSVKILNGFLGIAMFLFGVLKFVDPFKTWYATQVAASELPFQQLAYWAGQVGEIGVGVALLLIAFSTATFSGRQTTRILYAGNLLIVLMMLAAIYVHLHPQVPADVLPLKIRPPFIPGFFLLLALLSMYLHRKESSSLHLE
jgi:uncharacterized membrane protein